MVGAASPEVFHPTRIGLAVVGRSLQRWRFGAVEWREMDWLMKPLDWRDGPQSEGKMELSCLLNM